MLWPVKHIRVRLRDCVQAYETRAGKHLTYEELAVRAGVSRATIESIASRADYNLTLRTLERLCSALGVSLSQLLAWRDS